MSTLEERIRGLTLPLNGQYPRPWMTDLEDPARAKVFLVGKNQAKTFTVAQAGSHDRFLDALFNRNGQRCRRLYDEVTGGVPSLTRRNLDRVASLLRTAGVMEVLETNVICYSTAMSADLGDAHHRGGRERGLEIFTTLLEEIRPTVIIAHGADTRRELSRVLGVPLPGCPAHPGEWSAVQAGLKDYCLHVFVLPSLAPPAFNQWSRWADAYLGELSRRVAVLLRREMNSVCTPCTARETPPQALKPEQAPQRVSEQHREENALRDNWAAFFRKWFPLYGGGGQTSRVSFCLPRNGARFFKVEPMASGKRLSLMTRNYGVSMPELDSALTARGFRCRCQEKYLEVAVENLERAVECLRLFMERIPQHDRVSLE